MKVRAMLQPQFVTFTDRSPHSFVLVISSPSVVSILFLHSAQHYTFSRLCVLIALNDLIGVDSIWFAT